MSQEFALLRGLQPNRRHPIEIWDRGSYRAEQWTDDVIVFELDGRRLRGRYNLNRLS
jgi:hypothetical protein